MMDIMRKIDLVTELLRDLADQVGVEADHCRSAEKGEVDHAEYVVLVVDC